MAESIFPSDAHEMAYRKGHDLPVKPEEMNIDKSTHITNHELGLLKIFGLTAALLSSGGVVGYLASYVLRKPDTPTPIISEPLDDTDTHLRLRILDPD